MQTNLDEGNGWDGLVGWLGGMVRGVRGIGPNCASSPTH